MTRTFNSGLRPVTALYGIVLAAALTTSASAATQTTTMGVSATVNDNCTVSASSVAFGNIDVLSATAPTATGGITVKCTTGTAWTATASAGGGSGATATLRKMTHATDATKTLNYALYTDSGYVTVWGDGSTGSGITGTGTGADDARTVYAKVPTGQNTATKGSYSDSVTVTVTYP
jgi:spore coat protein U-like protein